MSPRLALMCSATLVFGAFGAFGAAGCGKKSSSGGLSADVTGLAAVPATAEVVIAIDVQRVVGSALVEHAADMLLERDPVLAERWKQLHDTCKLDLKSVDHVVLAIGPHAGPQPGTGPVLLVATGKLVETELAACVRSMVGTGSGGLTASPLGNRTMYQAKDGKRVMYFAFGRPDTVIMGANEQAITEALGTGKKITDNPDFAKWLALVDQKAPIWAVGRVDDRVRDGLVKVMKGGVSAGPTAMVASIDPTAGVKIELGAVMTSPADAKALESFANTQLAALGMVAQAKSLGTIVDQVKITADASLVRFAANLDMTAVNQLISVLDGGGGSAQSAPPPAGSNGSGGL
ncbi:MAG: hypothetical protein ABI467_33105 [Kofleriaceae bacterium]